MKKIVILVPILFLFIVFGCSKNEDSIDDTTVTEQSDEDLLLKEYWGSVLYNTYDYNPDLSYKSRISYNEFGDSTGIRNVNFENDTLTYSIWDGTVYWKWYKLSDTLVREDQFHNAGSFSGYKLHTLSSVGCGAEVVQYFDIDGLHYKTDSLEFIDGNCSSIDRHFEMGDLQQKEIKTRDDGNFWGKSILNPLLEGFDQGNVVFEQFYTPNNELGIEIEYTIDYNEYNYPVSITNSFVGSSQEFTNSCVYY